MIEPRRRYAGLRSVLFWSVISAAFVGPGTVTTAAAAGSSFQLELLWALIFSTVACALLQEAAVRVKLASGQPLGALIARRFSDHAWIPMGVTAAILVGGVAYQAGNVLGAVAGLMLLTTVPGWLLTASIVTVATGVLWFGRARQIAAVLGGLVALMGLLFVAVAIQVDPPWLELASGAFRPGIPAGSSLLVIALIGTTIVPYNLFLASGLGGSQSPFEMRIGVVGAVVLGGLTSGAILVAGTAVQGPFSFEALAMALRDEMGAWAGVLLGLGLFAAGATSAITAPLAASITAATVAGGLARARASGDVHEHTRHAAAGPEATARWDERGWAYRLVWLAVMAAGLAFAVSGIRPVPAIIVAQAANGVLLPLVAVFLVLAVNDGATLGASFVNGRVANTAMLLVVGVAVFLGATAVVRAVAAAASAEVGFEAMTAWLAALAVGCMAILAARLRALRGAAATGEGSLSDPTR